MGNSLVRVEIAHGQFFDPRDNVTLIGGGAGR